MNKTQEKWIRKLTELERASYAMKTAVLESRKGMFDRAYSGLEDAIQDITNFMGTGEGFEY